MILTNARIATFDSSNRVLDSGSIEVRADGAIGSVRSGCTRGGDVVDVGGRLVMPALINCHTHLYGTLARGLVLPGPPPPNFRSILSKLWWRLDRALTAEDVYYSALVGLIDSAKSGVGTVIDHHSSPNACAGSLDQVERAFRKLGLRGATCYETSERDCALPGIQENTRFIESRRPGALVDAAFGLHAAFTLTDRTLDACVEANQPGRAPYHVHVAEDRCDRSAVTRLAKHGILDERTLAAHCIRVSAEDIGVLACRGVNVIHNPQSNCNNFLAIADVTALSRRGVLVGLGSDGYSPRLWDEFKTALHLQKLRTRNPSSADMRLLLNNRTIIKKVWGLDLGRIEAGAKADLLLLDYFPPTPLRAGNIFSHLLFGMSNAPVNSLIVNGKYVLRDGHCIGIDERRVAAKAAVRAKALWERL